MQISPLAGFFSTTSVRAATKVLRNEGSPESAEALLKTRHAMKQAALKKPPAPPSCGKNLDIIA